MPSNSALRIRSLRTVSAKIQYDKHRTDYVFEIGDLVLLEEHPLSRKALGYAAGLAPQREGPYKVIACENRLNYQLEYVGNTKTRGEVVWAHIAQMTKYIPRETDGISPSGGNPGEPTNSAMSGVQATVQTDQID